MDGTIDQAHRAKDKGPASLPNSLRRDQSWMQRTE
jgi:hypothetical protein